MRWCLFLLLAALLPAQSTPESGGTAATIPTARLEGQVSSQAGEPLRKATVRLEPYGGSRQNAVAYTDTSDTNGDMKLVPMLEIRIPKTNANLPSQAELTPFNISINDLDGNTNATRLDSQRTPVAI